MTTRNEFDRAISSDQVCIHLHANPDNNFHRRFTGQGFQQHLLCDACAKLDPAEVPLAAVCAARFAEIEAEGCWEGLLGHPEVRYRDSGLRLEHRGVGVGGADTRSWRVLQPIADHPDQWLVLDAQHRLLRLDTGNGSISLLADLAASGLKLDEPVSLAVSPCGSYAALTEDGGYNGTVVSLADGRQTMSLNRGEYHNCLHTPFPCTFTRYRDRLLLVHATDWNRLDVSDPATGGRLTARESPEYRQGEPSPPNYLDFFHGRLHASADGRWIADDGWIWQPFGMVRTWSLQDWLDANVWESENGTSLHYLNQRGYYWNGPMCWTTDGLLAVWGYGVDDLVMVPAICLYDALTGALQKWFALPVSPRPPGSNAAPEVLTSYQLLMSFDTYLLLYGKSHGLSAWDIDEGACLFHVPDLVPLAWHPARQEFASVDADGSLRLSRLVQAPALTAPPIPPSPTLPA